MIVTITQRYANIRVPFESVMLSVVANQSITHTISGSYLTYQMQELQCQALAVGLHAASLHICTACACFRRL